MASYPRGRSSRRPETRWPDTRWSTMSGASAARRTCCSRDPMAWSRSRGSGPGRGPSLAHRGPPPSYRGERCFFSARPIATSARARAKAGADPRTRPIRRSRAAGSGSKTRSTSARQWSCSSSRFGGPRPSARRSLATIARVGDVPDAHCTTSAGRRLHEAPGGVPAAPAAAC